MTPAKGRATPGPWRWEHADKTPTKIAVSTLIGPSYVLCRYWPSLPSCEPDADARLIAASPMLLDFAKEIVEAWGDAVDKDEDISGCDAVDYLSQLVRTARSRIRAAEGE